MKFKWKFLIPLLPLLIIGVPLVAIIGDIWIALRKLKNRKQIIKYLQEMKYASYE